MTEEQMKKANELYEQIRKIRERKRVIEASEQIEPFRFTAKGSFLYVADGEGRAENFRIEMSQEHFAFYKQILLQQIRKELEVLETEFSSL